MKTRTRSRIQRTRSRKPWTRLRTDTLAHTTRSYDETPGASIFCDARLRPPGPRHPIATQQWQTRVHTGLRWLGCVAWKGLTISIPSEVVVSQPRGSNKNRGTSKGSLTRSEGREIGSSPGDVPVSRRLDDSLLSVVLGTPNMTTPTNILPAVCYRTFCRHYVYQRLLYSRTLTERSPESFSHNSSARNSRPPDSDMRESRMSSSWSVRFVS